MRRLPLRSFCVNGPGGQARSQRARRLLLPCRKMSENIREFQVGPDGEGRVWSVQFVWLQTAISIRHADAVDVKFLVSDGTLT